MESIVAVFLALRRALGRAEELVIRLSNFNPSARPKQVTSPPSDCFFLYRARARPSKTANDES